MKLVNDGKDPLFEDEFHIKSDRVCSRGWSPPAVQRIVTTPKRQTWYSCIVTCSFEKIVAFEVYQDTIDAEKFRRHLILLQKTLSSRQRRNSVLIFDGAPSHRALKTKRWIEQSNLHCL